MRIHFIAIGGSAMHNLAIALSLRGDEVTGSDDEIFEPSRTRLMKYGLLPEREGWFPGRVDRSIDAVILGMHARADNPELLRAQELKLPVFSYPEFLYEQSRNKRRVVIGGSHGKTTITSMILHVLERCGLETDYMVGAQLDGFEVMVRLSSGAPVMVIEGDEYLTSALDPRPKFHVYRPDIALISGIAWDHMNVFKTYDAYIDQFRIFASMVPPDGRLIYCQDDGELNRLVSRLDPAIRKTPYGIPEYRLEQGVTLMRCAGMEVPLQIFGKHNLLNINGARMACREFGVSDEQFAEAIGSFRGASGRLELIAEGDTVSVFRDFAHAPSKLKATIQAVREQFPGRELFACFELHTYSSLNLDFLPQYRGAMEAAHVPVVFFNPHTLQMKHLPLISEQEVKNAFADERLQVFTDSRELAAFLHSLTWKNKNLLLMSSGNFDGLDLCNLAGEITRQGG